MAQPPAEPTKGEPAAPDLGQAHPPAPPHHPPDTSVDILARTIWGEARGEGKAGMTAVACVIMKRAAHPRWWGTNVTEVCLAHDQFSCWDASSPELHTLKAVTHADPQFAEALTIAAVAVAGRLADTTHGADSYANLAVSHPPWADPTKETTRIGHHTFYRLET